MPYGIPNPMDDDGSGEVKTNEDDEAQDETQKPDMLELVHCMMDANFDANVRAIHGETPLHLAASAGSSWCVSVLISMYGKVGINDNNELSPLHYAIRDDKPQIVATLVNAGCDVNHKDIEGNTPIHYAASKNSIECIKVLHSLEADLNAKNAIGRTALHLAAELGHRDAVEELLNKGADPNIRDINGVRSCIYWAPLRLAIKGDFQDISQLLLDHGTIPY